MHVHVHACTTFHSVMWFRRVFTGSCDVHVHEHVFVMATVLGVSKDIMFVDDWCSTHTQVSIIG